MNGSLPLAGRRIVITRARRQSGPLADSLRALGAEVIELPLIEIVPPASYGPLDDALRNISAYQWVIITSANTVRVLAERIRALGLGSLILSGLKIAAIGSGTAAEIEKCGWHVSCTSHEYVAESLVAALGPQVDGRRILLARATVARDVIPDELKRLGATVDIVEAYRTILPPEAVQEFRNAFGDPKRLPEAVAFTSSSTVKNFFEVVQDSGLSLASAAVKALSIGPITSATLREHGWEPAIEASRHDVQGLVNASLAILHR